MRNEVVRVEDTGHHGLGQWVPKQETGRNGAELWYGQGVGVRRSRGFPTWGCNYRRTKRDLEKRAVSVGAQGRR